MIFSAQTLSYVAYLPISASPNYQIPIWHLWYLYRTKRTPFHTHTWIHTCTHAHEYTHILIHTASLSSYPLSTPIHINSGAYENFETVQPWWVPLTLRVCKMFFFFSLCKWMVSFSRDVFMWVCECIAHAWHGTISFRQQPPHHDSVYWCERAPQYRLYNSERCRSLNVCR